MSQKHAYVFIFEYHLQNGQSLTAHTLRRAKRPQRSCRPLKFCGQIHQTSHRLHRRGSFVCSPSVRDEASYVRLTKRKVPQEDSKRTAPFSRPRHTIPSQLLSALSSLPLTVNVPPSAGSRKVAVVFAGTVVPNVHVLPFKTDKTSILPCGDS